MAATGNTGSKGKASPAKAGGQKGFEDDMRKDGIKPILSKSSDEPTTDEEDTEVLAKPKQVTEENDSMTSEVANNETSGDDVTVETVLSEVGLTTDTATPKQIDLAGDTVERIREGGVSLDGLKDAMNSIIAQNPPDENGEKAPDSMSDSAVSTRTVAATSGAAVKKIIPNGKVMTQPDLLLAILQAKTIYTRYQFGNCNRWWKTAKNQAQGAANTIQAFDKPEKHGLTHFAVLDGEQLFLGEADVTSR